MAKCGTFYYHHDGDQAIHTGEFLLGWTRFNRDDLF